MGRRIRFLTLLVASGLVLAILVMVLATGQQAIQPPLPSPNGIDDIVRAARAIKGNYEELNKIATDELRALVAGDAEALKIARVGLNRECRVALPPNANSFPEYMTPFGKMRHLGQALSAEGRLADITGQPAAAADSYLDAMLLGQQISRGGMVIHHMVGIALETAGTSRMQTVVPRLDAATCHRLANKLEGMEIKRQPVEEVIQTEHWWCRHALGFREQLSYLMSLRQSRLMEQRHVTRAQTQIIKSRELLVALASRAYELEKGRRPAKLQDLVPAYLRAVPLDPVTRTNLVFVP